jgi:hypothetical protein
MDVACTATATAPANLPDRIAMVPAAMHASLKLLHAPLLLLDRDLGLRHASGAAGQLLGMTGEEIRRRWPRLQAELGLVGLDCLRPGGQPLCVTRDAMLSGRRCPLRLEIHALAAGRDAYLVLLKDRERIDEPGRQLIRARRLQALGFLGPTIAHDPSAPCSTSRSPSSRRPAAAAAFRSRRVGRVAWRRSRRGPRTARWTMPPWSTCCAGCRMSRKKGSVWSPHGRSSRRTAARWREASGHAAGFRVTPPLAAIEPAAR